MGPLLAALFCPLEADGPRSHALVDGLLLARRAPRPRVAELVLALVYYSQHVCFRRKRRGTFGIGDTTPSLPVFPGLAAGGDKRNRRAQCSSRVCLTHLVNCRYSFRLVCYHPGVIPGHADVFLFSFSLTALCWQSRYTAGRPAESALGGVGQCASHCKMRPRSTQAPLRNHGASSGLGRRRSRATRAEAGSSFRLVQDGGDDGNLGAPLKTEVRGVHIDGPRRKEDG